MEECTKTQSIQVETRRLREGERTKEERKGGDTREADSSHGNRIDSTFVKIQKREKKRVRSGMVSFARGYSSLPVTGVALLSNESPRFRINRETPAY